MSATLSVVKTLLLPAIFSLVLYLLATCVLFPLWTRHHSRYTSYLTTHLQSLQTLLPSSRSLAAPTNTFRARLQDALATIILPSIWQRERELRRYNNAGDGDGSGSDFDEDDGEELYDVGPRRREALSLDAGRRGGIEAEERRLSRDLEEGFKDDSSEEEEEEIGR